MKEKNKRIDNNLTRNLLFGFFASLAILVVSSTTSYISVKDLLKSFEWVDHTNLVTQKLTDITASLIDAETATRGHLLTKDETFLDPYKGSPTRVKVLLSEVEQLTSDNGLQRRNIKILKNEIAFEMQVLAELIERSHRSNAVRSDSLTLGKFHMDKIRERVDLMIGIEQRLAKKRSASVNNFTTFTRICILVASLLSVTITILFYFRIRNNYDANVTLHMKLEERRKLEDHQIDVISRHAEKVAGGDYSARIDASLFRENDNDN